jgi:hypothetical protein
MPRTFRPCWLDRSNYAWRRVQVMKLTNTDSRPFILRFTMYMPPWNSGLIQTKLKFV